MTEALAKINRFVEVYASWLLNIYNLYFSTTPALVTIKRFANTTTYEVEEVDIPNLAMHKAGIITASGIVPGSVTQIGDSGGAPFVELVPDTPDVMAFTEGVTAWDIDVYGCTPGESASPSNEKIKVTLEAEDDGAGGLSFNIQAFSLNPGFSGIGWMEWGVSGTDSYSGSLVASGSSADNKLHLFVRNENNLDPDVTSHFKAAVRKTVIYDAAA